MKQPERLLAVLRWAREQEQFQGGLTSGSVIAPHGLTLGEAFKTLADCAAVGMNAAGAGIVSMDMLDDPH